MITSFALLALAINAAVMFSLYRKLSRHFVLAMKATEDFAQAQVLVNQTQLDINSHHAVLLASLMGSRTTNVLNLGHIKRKFEGEKQ